MILKANVKEAVRSLLGAKQRTILALVGIIIGIGSVIAMISIGTIVQKEALRQFQEMGTDIVTISFSGGGNTLDQVVTIQEALSIPTQCPEIGKVAPYESIYGTLKYKGNKWDGPALGVTPTFADLNKLTLTEGRFVSELDQYMYYGIASQKVLEKLAEFGIYDTDDVIGQNIHFNDKLFTIMGTINKVPMGSMRPYEINEGLIIPISTVTRLNGKNQVSNIVARLRSGGNHITATQQLQAYFGRIKPKINVQIRSAEEIIDRMQKQMRMFTLLLGAIGSISLIVGGVGVMNVMLVSVAERKKEIGIRRALGAQQSDIQGQFLIESVMLCLVGGGMGIILGVGASYIISYFSKWQFGLSYMAIFLGVGVSAAIGIFFGFYPARQAARLNPIMALRAE